MAALPRLSLVNPSWKKFVKCRHIRHCRHANPSPRPPNWTSKPRKPVRTRTKNTLRLWNSTPRNREDEHHEPRSRTVPHPSKQDVRLECETVLSAPTNLNPHHQNPPYLAGDRDPALASRSRRVVRHRPCPLHGTGLSTCARKCHNGRGGREYAPPAVGLDQFGEFIFR